MTASSPSRGVHNAAVALACLFDFSEFVRIFAAAGILTNFVSAASAVLVAGVWYHLLMGSKKRNVRNRSITSSVFES